MLPEGWMEGAVLGFLGTYSLSVLRTWPSCWPHTCPLDPVSWMLAASGPAALPPQLRCSVSGPSPGPAPGEAWVSSFQRFASDTAGGV